METAEEMQDLHDVNSDLRERENNNKMDQLDISVDELLSRPRPTRRMNRFLYQAPEFVTRLNAFEEVTAGSTVTFSCQWKSFPNPTLKWYKDDQEITEDERYKVQAEEDGVHQLVIENAKRFDEGTYKCKAENQEGVASTTGYLSVTGDIAEKPLSAQPRRNQSDHSVSHAPALRVIQEQKSLEEREEVEYSSLPPSPLTEFIDTVRREHSWPFGRIGYNPRTSGDDDEKSDSDTSVESQDYDRVSIDFDPEVDVIVSPGLEAKPPPSYEEVQALRKLQAEIEEASAREMAGDVNGSPPPEPDHNDDGLFVKNEKDSSNSDEKQARLERTVELSENGLDTSKQNDTTEDRTVMKPNSNEDEIVPANSEVSFATPITTRGTTGSESLRDILCVGLTDLCEAAVNPPFIYYAFFISVCTLIGSGLEISPPIYILLVAFLALISFRLFLHPQKEVDKQT